MSTTSIPILGTAFFCLILGLLMFVRNSKSRAAMTSFQVTNLLCWLLVALFPALIIFSFFPQNSSIQGNIFGFSVGGAVALFVFTWWFGTKKSLEAVNMDDLTDRLRGLQDDLQRCQEGKSGNGQERKATVLTETREFAYSIKKYPRKSVALVTGNIQGIRCAHIWVNSENTNMQMARYFDRSISGTIRYHGATRDKYGDVVDDVIFKELTNQMAGKNAVQPSTVLITGAGNLELSHHVKKIFHVAAVRGQVGSGYQPIDNIESCVSNALDTTRSSEFSSCKSILFPLLGTGTAKANLAEVAIRLLTASIGFLESTEDTSIETVYFLTWTDRELAACRDVMDGLDRVEARNQ
jgi:O-acetyl-ADP-ribose deacetylase (regulator of RNase III)